MMVLFKNRGNLKCKDEIDYFIGITSPPIIKAASGRRVRLLV